MIDSTSSSNVGVRGIVTAVSKNCFYLLVDVIQRQRVVYVDEDGQSVRGDEGQMGDDQPISKRKQKKLDRKQFILDRQQSANSTTGEVVSSVSKSTLSVVVTPTSSGDKQRHNKPVLGRILRLVKDQCNLALVLPSLSDQQSSGGMFNAEPDLDALSAKTPVKSSSGTVGSKRSRGDGENDDDEEQGSGDESDNNSNDSSSDEGSSDVSDSSDGEGVTRYAKKGPSQVSTTVGTSRVTAGLHLDGESIVAGMGDVGKVVAEPLVVFDGNEKSNGGRLCILYGKHYMPHCKYDAGK